MSDFHDNLKEAMSIKCISTKDLADKTGIKEGTISNYLKTKGSLPNIESGLKIADALGVSVRFLVTGFEGDDGTALDKENRALYRKNMLLLTKIASLEENERASVENLITDFKTNYHTSKE